MTSLCFSCVWCMIAAIKIISDSFYDNTSKPDGDHNVKR